MIHALDVLWTMLATGPWSHFVGLAVVCLIIHLICRRPDGDPDNARHPACDHVTTRLMIESDARDRVPTPDQWVWALDTGDPSHIVDAKYTD